MSGIFTVIFRDDDAWVIFDRCRRVYLPSQQGSEQTWASYEQAQKVCTELNQNDTARREGISVSTPVRFDPAIANLA